MPAKKVAAYPSVRFIDTEAIEATADGVIAGGSLHQALVFEPNGRWSATERTVTTSCLIDAAEGRDFPMHARFGVLRGKRRALNRNVERVLNQSRKDTH